MSVRSRFEASYGAYVKSVRDTGAKSFDSFEMKTLGGSSIDYIQAGSCSCACICTCICICTCCFTPPPDENS